MTIKKIFVLSVLILGTILTVPVLVSAQDTPSNSATTVLTQEASTAISQNTTLNGELQPLDGVKTVEIKGIPSNFGLWWRNISEWVSTALITDPVEKAEKQLTFAEERIKLANYIIDNSTDPKVQEKAKSMLEKADEYIKKIEEKKNEIAAKKDERAKKLLENVAKHELNKETVLEKVEDTLSPEALAEFQQLRAKMEQTGKDFLKSLQADPNVSQEIKDAVSKVLLQVQVTQKAREQIREQEKPVIDAIKEGLDSAKEEFQQMREQRKQDLEKLRKQYKTEKQAIIDKIQAGEKGAVEELKALNKKMQQTTSEVKEETKQKVEQLKDNLEKAREDAKQQMEQKREQIKQQAEDMKCATASDCPVIVCAEGSECKGYQCKEGKCELEDK